MNELSTKELLCLLGRADVKIIDVRSVDAYNGWQLQNESRSGHIEGAKSLSISWVEYIDWIEIVRSKNILPQHSIVIYGNDLEHIQQVANRFVKAGYTDVSMYNHFVSEWCVNPDLPMVNLSRFQHLVPAEWVNRLITKHVASHFNGGKYVVVHAHYRNRDAYLSGHIPGAIDMDTLALESPDTWNRRSPQELKDSLENHGISFDTTVILYGKYLSPDNSDDFPGSAAGHLGAIRCALIMMYGGVKDVRILNGGFQSWQDSGYPISKIDVPKKPVRDFGIEIPVHPEFIVDLPEAKEILKSSDANLVCVRSYQEYIGEVSGYNYIQAKGRISGAVFSDCGSDAYHMENYCNLDHTTREFSEIDENFKRSGITPERHNAFYCGTGWRGSEAFFNAWLMGWQRVSVYDGGWFEWSQDDLNPSEIGEPEEECLTSELQSV